MNINFNEIKLNDVDNAVILSLVEVIYNELKSNKYSNIQINELCQLKEKDTNVFEIELKEKPISTNDILIVTEHGAVITPNYISDLNGTKIIINSKNIKKTDDIFVTYKY